MADNVARKFADVKKMSGPSQAKCSALSLVISDLSDLLRDCAIKPGDDKFMKETYMPLARTISEEAPRSCQK
jgi:hypothetical protein